MRKITGDICLCGAFLAIFAAAAGMLSCTAAEETLKDGYYSAEAAEYDSYGWKEYVTICVSSGQIILVEYNAFNASGFIKSWDMNFMRVMNASNGTYPNAYTRHYRAKFLENQGIEGLDIVSGATRSYYSFLQLAGAVLENARSGDAEPRFVTLEIPETD
ncbi:MAG: FMN-binding protein [Treponema sp.]|nr:FMN-binding protein [Treponema sp.]